MAEQGPEAAAEHRSKAFAVLGQCAMAYGVHALMNAMQPAD
jgi:hypothetical protein